MKKLSLAAVLISLLIGLLAGCSVQQIISAPPIDLEKPYIAFSAVHGNQLDLNNYTRVEETTFDHYAHRYANCSGTVYYDTLSAADQKVYHILQYAMDNAYPCILVDERVTAGMTYSVEEVLTFFSLDSAVVEQNLAWEFGDFTITYSTTGTAGPAAELKGIQLYINDFSAEKRNKKDEAITKANEILSQMPQTDNDREKILYFYNWLGENVEYFLEARRDENADYLYDALCKGKTNCDGFANAFSLLCALSDIPCLEKIYVPEDGSAGHTWNTVKVDDAWYNVDATVSREVKESPSVLLHFGFEDARQEYTCKFVDLLPACTDSFLQADCYIDNLEGAADAVKVAFDMTENDYVIAVVSSGALEQSVLESIAQKLNRSISSRHYMLADGSAIYCIY